MKEGQQRRLRPGMVKGPAAVALVLFGGALLLAFLAFMMLMAGLFTFIEVPLHLIFGFFGFLGKNVPRISFNAATWVPGVIAFILAVVMVHRFVGAWARKRERRWTLVSSLALGLVIPVLFVIAFLVPGVLLQVEQLRKTPWTEKDRSAKRIRTLGEMKNTWPNLVMFASEHEGRYPDTLEELDTDRGWRSSSESYREDPVIYLGAGLTDEADPGLPLMISPPFSGKDGKPGRWVTTAGGDSKEIPADEVDVWIQRSLAARK